MNSCYGCLALTLSNPHGPGFCPLGFEIERTGHDKKPKGECARPRNHPELIAAMEEESE